MPISRIERKARAENKKELIREEIYGTMIEAAADRKIEEKAAEMIGKVISKELLSAKYYIRTNKVIKNIIKRKPQEKNLALSVVNEISDNPIEFINRMELKYASKE